MQPRVCHLSMKLNCVERRYKCNNKVSDWRLGPPLSRTQHRSPAQHSEPSAALRHLGSLSDGDLETRGVREPGDEGSEGAWRRGE